MQPRLGVISNITAARSVTRLSIKYCFLFHNACVSTHQGLKEFIPPFLHSTVFCLGKLKLHSACSLLFVGLYISALVQINNATSGDLDFRQQLVYYSYILTLLSHPRTPV